MAKEICERCSHWVVGEVTIYDDQTVPKWSMADGTGKCDQLKITTAADFGCAKFLVDDGDGDHIIKNKKTGKAWQDYWWGPCPDCLDKETGIHRGCYRCARTGRVRYYGDGFIGEEQTRLHPKEVPPKPKCLNCNIDVRPEWKHCPSCGFKVNEPVAEKEIVTAPDSRFGGGS